MAAVRLLSQAAAPRGNRQAHRADHPRRSENLRHGLAVSRKSASILPRASSTSRSIARRCSITTKPKTGRFSKKALPRPAPCLRSSPPAPPTPISVVNLIPFYFYYSMFGFQRIGDLIWAAADSKAKGFLLGATAGRTTLNGEGLQHQDGHSHLLASTVPTLLAYDAAFAYEIADDHQRRPAPPVCRRRGVFLLSDPLQRELSDAGHARRAPKRASSRACTNSSRPRNGKNSKRIFSAAARYCAKRCAPRKFSPNSSMSRPMSGARPATSCCAATRCAPNAGTCFIRRRRRKNPISSQCCKTKKASFVAVSDYMKMVPDQIAPWVPGGLMTSGTDGFGRSDTRANLRRFFEVDAEMTALATLYALHQKRSLPAQTRRRRHQQARHRSGKSLSLLPLITRKTAAHSLHGRQTSPAR